MFFMRSDAQANRELLLRSAADLFIANGDAVSMRAIATHAGVGMGTLYRHFPDREALITGLAEHLFGKINAAAQTALEAPLPQSFDDFFHTLAGLRIGGIIPALADDYGSTIPEHLWDLRAQALVQVQAVVTRAQEAGILRPEVTAIRLILGIIMGTRPLPPAAPSEMLDDAAWVLEHFLNSLKVA